MLASVFSKSRPVNFIIIALLLIMVYFAYAFKDTSWTASYLLIARNAALLVLLAGSLFLDNFITRRNGLSKANTYAMFLYMVFLMLFPTILVNIKVIVASFLIMLALRRLISMQSLITPKEKIFDASFWILAAAVFHFWCILFLFLVFVSIVFHVSRDYRNWLIPFIAFFAVAIIYCMVSLAITGQFFGDIGDQATVSFVFTYFENIYQRVALALFSSITALFAFSQFVSLPGKPLNMQASYKKIYVSFAIGVAIYVLSSGKNNSFLAFTFAPLSIMGANYLESQDNNWFREVVLGLLVAGATVLFVAQL